MCCITTCHRASSITIRRPEERGETVRKRNVCCFLKAGYHDKQVPSANKASAGDVASDMQKTANDQRKLQQMINYCETDKCLREFILSYFGDTTPCICNKCSNCVVVEDEEEETYVETGKSAKRQHSLQGLTSLVLRCLKSCAACVQSLLQKSRCLRISSALTRP